MTGGFFLSRITTTQLFKLINSEEYESFIQNYSDEITNPTATSFLKDLLDLKGIKPSELSRKALLDRSFTYQILNGTRKANRNLLLRFSFVLHLSLVETQHLLQIFQKGELYPRILRDVIIIYCINNNYDLFAANDFLIKQNQLPLFMED